MSEQKPYIAIAVLADLLEGKLTDYQIFLKHSIGIQTTMKLRELLKKHHDYKKHQTPDLG